MSSGPPSHWDRLPAELRRAVARRAGLLAQLTLGCLPTSGVDELSFEDKLRLCNEAAETGWQGDWAELPYTQVSGRNAFLSLRSRAAFERLKALPDVPPELLRGVALRNVWLDELGPLDNPVLVGIDSVAAGASRMLQHLFDAGMDPTELPQSMAELAARYGDVDMLRALHANAPELVRASRALQRATHYGHADAVEFLVAVSSDEHLGWSLRTAVSDGRLEMVKILAPRCTRLRRREALLRAAQRLDVDMFTWLLRNIPRDDIDIHQARQLVAQYGSPEIAAVFEHVAAERDAEL
ncbi:hypothetical protein HK105_203758 [Polyrhizophydium stewartii]|uniref:Ankyrin repeat domain-containing protein n=1 Tax=Polyrhizophydium stewartii TaxID=2732419 RepID=A0ABR4NAT5_9FUNG|nr:hypothetical protein HK105_001419 [Polyrhizophydium stewartii]